MISLDLMKSSEVRKAGDQSNCVKMQKKWLSIFPKCKYEKKVWNRKLLFHFLLIKNLHIFRSLLSPKYSILDAQGQVALTIEGPICTYSICGDVEFEILSPDGSTNVGKISKQW